MIFINGCFTPCMWMHVFFMKFTIEIVFLGRGDRVIKLDRELKPWRASSVAFARGKRSICQRRGQGMEVKAATGLNLRLRGRARRT